ncbi:unnamed protein product [Ambrosiozyma monospora]|uniref:Unnamed protein product n=1 Tax=Ambrosiozyma monospora TaxID=43982 RepID=A0A9W7DFF1_AMBMO|nr:unnamed protein product [Ambrosiozyma monospora]
MNIVKKLFATKGEQSNDKLILLSSGQLVLSRAPSSPKSENQCLFNDVLLSIKETSLRYNYQLVVHKPKVTDAPLFVGDDDSDDGSDLLQEDSNILKSFLIDEKLKLTLTEKFGNQTLTWKDLDGDLGDRFEYRINSAVVTSNSIDQFLLALYKCEYERKYRKSSDKVTPKDLQEFVVEDDDDELLNPIKSSTRSSTVVKGLDSDSDDDFQDADENVEVEGDLLGEVKCKLYIYVPDTSSFKTKASKCSASIHELKNWNYLFTVKNDETNEDVLVTYVVDQLNPDFRFEQLSFLFNRFTEDDVDTYLLKFDDEGAYDRFQSLFASSMWQYKNRSKWVKVKTTDQEFITDAFNNLSLAEEEMVELNEDDDFVSAQEDDFEEKTANVSKSLRQGKSKVVADESDDEDANKFTGNETNKGLKIGSAHDRTFISRGNTLGVFRSNEENDIEFYTAIQNISSSKNKNLKVNPDKMMLQKGDSVMIVQDNKDLNTLFRLDLERGQIVEDWKMEKDGTALPVVNYTTNEKFGDRTDEQTFLGISSQSLFRVDPRLTNKVKSNCMTSLVRLPKLCCLQWVMILLV